MNLITSKQGRRLQISLRAWLVVVSTVILAGGWWTQSAIRQRQIVEALKAASIGCQYDCDKFYGSKTTWAKLLVPGWVRKGIGKDFFHSVSIVSQDRFPGEPAPVPVRAAISQFRRVVA